MAVVIPSLNIDPKSLHRARRKLQTKQPDNAVVLTADEREAVLALIQRGKRTLYLGPQQIDRYQYMLAQITEINPALEPAKFNHFTEKIEAFEQKWCK